MKKVLIAFFGLVAFASCSEDSQEPLAQENSDHEIPISASSYVSNIGGFIYESPYDGAGGGSGPYYLPFEFNVQAPIDRLEITPYVGLTHSNVHQSMLVNPKCVAPGTICPICSSSPFVTTHFINFLQYGNDVAAIGTLSPLMIPNGITNLVDCYAAIPVYPGNPCPTVPFLFDYGVPLGGGTGPLLGTTEPTLIAENSKIYYIEYKFQAFGQNFSGILKHQVGDDSLTESDYVNSGQWRSYSDFPQLSGSIYDGVIAMENLDSKEIILAQRDNPTTPLNSEVKVTDPATSIDYYLRFRHEANKIVIEFKP